MWTGTIAHNNLLDRGRVGDWASHDIEHELSAMYNITHGAGLAIVFPAWIRYVHHANLDRFVQYAVRVWDISLPLNDKEEIVEAALERLEAFYKLLGLPTRLSEIGIGSENFEKMAKNSLIGERTHLGNFVKLYAEDVEKIYWLAL